MSRQRGYNVTIKCFVPMGEGLAGQVATGNSLLELEDGDLSGLAEIADKATITVTAKQTSRPVE